MAGPTTVDEYLATLPPDRRAVMEDLRRTIRAAAPDAEELISYNMPAFKSNGRFLVSDDAYKAHYSLFPGSQLVVETLGDEVLPYVWPAGARSASRRAGLSRSRRSRRSSASASRRPPPARTSEPPTPTPRGRPLPDRILFGSRPAVERPGAAAHPRPNDRRNWRSRRAEDGIDG